MAKIDPTLTELFHKQFPCLTEKEAQRALLFYLGFNAAQIGKMLGITGQSVLDSLARVQGKLGVPTRKMLISYINISLFAGAFLDSREVLQEARGILLEVRKTLEAMK